MIQRASVCASGAPAGVWRLAWGPKFEGERASATLWTDAIMLLTYCRAIAATLSWRWTSNTNWNAIVITDFDFPDWPAQSPEALFPAGPTSRAEARSSVRFGLEASCRISKCTNFISKRIQLQRMERRK